MGEFILFKVTDVDSNLYIASKIFRENCDEVIKLKVLNNRLLSDISYLLKEKFKGVRKLEMYGNTLRIETTWDGKLTTREVLDIEELVGCTLDEIKDNYYYFDLIIDGNYGTIGTNLGKNISDFREDYNQIRYNIYGR